MTLYKELDGNALRAYEQMVAKLRQNAKQQLKLSDAELVVRPLRPNDVSTRSDWYFDGNQVTGSAWSTPTSVSAQVIANGRFVGINGVFNQATGVAGSITAIRITREGAVAREWMVDAVKNWRHQCGWADDPVTLDQNTSFTLSLLQGITGTLLNQFGLLGAVVEKRGLLISP